MPSTKPASTSLEQALERYEAETNSPSAQRELEEYGRRCVEHPGLTYLDGVYAHYLGLQYFLSSIEDKRLDPDMLVGFSMLAKVFYTPSRNGVQRSYLWEETDEELDDAAMADLAAHTPPITKGMLEDCQSRMRELEKTRSKIIATGALLAKQTDASDAVTLDLMHLFLTLRSRFKLQFNKLAYIGAFGDLKLAVEETRKMRPRDGKPLLATEAPKRLYKRNDDYRYGKRINGSRPTLENKGGNISLDDMSTEEALSAEKYLADYSTLPEALLRDERQELLYKALAELPPAERAAIENAGQGKKLGVAARQAKSRALKKLKKLLEK
ncbi:MAG: hypothetical protein ABSE76_02050 [Minisyncoccia bacterium]|jgi:cytochrome c553